jgi:hypothetical protein
MMMVLLLEPDLALLAVAKKIRKAELIVQNVLLFLMTATK